MSISAIDPILNKEAPILEVNVTDKLYTLYENGSVILNWDDIQPLRDALPQLRQGRGTFIKYNEAGRDIYSS